MTARVIREGDYFSSSGNVASGRAFTAALQMPAITAPQLAFEISDRGYTIYAYYLPEPNHGLAQIEIFKDGAEVRISKYEAYRIWNLAAHFADIVDDLEARAAVAAAEPSLHMLGDRPPQCVRALRVRVYGWRGRPLCPDGAPFIYHRRSAEWPDHFDVEVWDGEQLVPLAVCDDEIFHDPRLGRDLHERSSK